MSLKGLKDLMDKLAVIEQDADVYLTPDEMNAFAEQLGTVAATLADVARERWARDVDG